MRIATLVAAAGTAALLGAGSAVAAPMAPAPLATPHAMLQPAVQIGPAPKLELVRGGCGFGEHRTFRGFCHYNHGWRGRRRFWHNHRWWHHRRWWHHGWRYY